MWTSGAQLSDIGEIICRTDPEQPKHKGMTSFVVDMHAPGVEIRPLRQMTGGACSTRSSSPTSASPTTTASATSEQGWGVALTTLMNERASIGSGVGLGLVLADRLAEMLAPLRPRPTTPCAPASSPHVYIGVQVARSHVAAGHRPSCRPGSCPGRRCRSLKLALTNNLRRTARLRGRGARPALTADTGEWGTYAWSQLLLGIPGMRVAGGTDEVMKNIVGERVLGLPKDPGIDSKTPFKDLLVGTQTLSSAVRSGAVEEGELRVGRPGHAGRRSRASCP